MKASIIIIDDEPRAHHVLENYILRIPQLTIAGKFLKALDAFDFIGSNRVDIVLLDITMPQLDGFAFLRMLEKPPLVIFTTAHSEYALESYEYNAIDYLKKPIPFERFLKAVTKALQTLQSAPDNIIPDKIQLKIDGGIKALPFEDILYFQSLGNYIKIYTNGKLLLTQITTHEIEDILPREVFLRIHKSFIVNKSKIAKVTDGEVFLGQVNLPIGKTFKKYVQDSLKVI